MGFPHVDLTEYFKRKAHVPIQQPAVVLQSPRAPMPLTAADVLSMALSMRAKIDEDQAVASQQDEADAARKSDLARLASEKAPAFIAEYLQPIIDAAGGALKLGIEQDHKGCRVILGTPDAIRNSTMIEDRNKPLDYIEFVLNAHNNGIAVYPHNDKENLRSSSRPGVRGGPVRGPRWTATADETGVREALGKFLGQVLDTQTLSRMQGALATPSQPKPQPC